MRLLTAIICLFGVLVSSALAQESVPPGNIYDTAPFSSAQHFTSVPCGKPFVCGTRVTDEVYLAAANTCAQKRLGFPANMMTVFIRDEGNYENCALPETYAPKSANLGAVAQWPICCIQERDDGRCEFKCHFYSGGGVQ